MGFKRRKRQWANCPRQPWGGQVTSAPETAELAGLLFSAARPSPPHLSQRAPSLWTAVAVSWQTFCSTVSRSASKAWILLTKPFLFILLSLKFSGRISVNLLQDLHKLLDRGFYSPIEFAESFSLQIFGQKTLWRNDALFQVFL